MPLLVQVECDRCRFVPDDIAAPFMRGKIDGGMVRRRAQADGWLVRRDREGYWRYYCQRCQKTEADLKR